MKYILEIFLDIFKLKSRKSKTLISIDCIYLKLCLFETLIKVSEYKITKQFIKIKCWKGIQFNAGALNVNININKS